MNPSYKLGNRGLTGEKTIISEQDFERFNKLRELEGITKKWYDQNKSWLTKYLDYVNWRIDEDKTLDYYQLLKNQLSITYYRKKVYHIRKFLEYLQVEWANKIKLPDEPEYIPKHITYNNIEKTLSLFKEHKFFKQIKAILFLGAYSGMRAGEIYQLQPRDIDIEDRTIQINHNPAIGQTTKTKRSRIVFINFEAQEALSDYLDFFNNGSDLRCLFTKSHLSRLFNKSELKVKDLRKYFSQEWDRRGGPTSIKKILLGHSLKGDVDLMHYNFQSEEDLKKIYDKVFLK